MSDGGLFQIASQGSVYGVWALVVIAIITLIKGWPALRKLSIEADGSLRKDLFDRIKDLEQQLRDEQIACDAKLTERDHRIERAEDRVKGLERQLVQMQMSAGIPIPLTSIEPDPAANRLIENLKDKS